MGRKSSAKTQAAASSPPPPPGRSSSRLFAVALVAIVTAIALFVYLRGSRSEVSDGAASAASADQVAADAAAMAKFGPHRQDKLPPLEFPAYTPPRSPEIIRAAYEFAAEHPEILSYVPCFCGCERSGHRGNHDCFVRARDINGDVIEWDPHGIDCTVCLDVATRSKQMFEAGASVKDIRAAIEKEWGARATNHTPTPSAPGN